MIGVSGLRKGEGGEGRGSRSGEPVGTLPARGPGPGSAAFDSLGLGGLLFRQQPGMLFHAPGDQVGEADAIEEVVDLVAQVIPEGMGQAALAITAVLATPATGEFDPLVNGADDVGDGDLGRGLAQIVAAPRATHATDELLATQGGEELLQIRQGDALIDGDVGQGHGPLALVEGQVEHGRDRVSALGGKSHMGYLSLEDDYLGNL